MRNGDRRVSVFSSSGLCFAGWFSPPVVEDRRYIASLRGTSATCGTGCLLNYSGVESDAFSLDMDDSDRSDGDVPEQRRASNGSG
jgi:hypothetical protein